ncbi:MAG: GWxTD domain-containing protein [Lentimicrobiaceae bacterium]|nr:GWxTD domain-containing protein [Lentimicrobiaceae bacterium]
MKKILLFTLLLVFVSSIFAQKLSVLIDYKSYCTSTGAPYLEISSFVNGQTVIYAPTDKGKFEAEVRITVQAFQSDSLVGKLDYILVSEQFEDSIAATKPDFGNFQNLQLPNGEYLLQFSVHDIHAATKPIYFADIAVLNYSHDKVSISDISLYRNMSREPKGDIFDKYGFSLEPLFYGFVPESMYTLPFSCEIYNTDKLAEKEQLTIKSYITCFENNMMPYPEARHTAQVPAKSVIVAFGEIGIFKLPSGNYNLIVDVFSKDSVLLATNSFFFQRSNPTIKLHLEDFSAVNVKSTFVDQFKDSIQLLEYVRFLYPISTPVEREFYSARMMHLIPLEILQKFFYAFWLKRDPINPENAWTAYLAKIKHVDKEFGCKIIQGYRTDRGRVYLQYGPPNSIFESPFDSHSYPYEIWHYYYCVDQSNVKFIFWNTDLVSNDYELLHSDKRGEMQDPFWQIKVTQRKTPIFNFEERTPESYFGGNPKDDWFNHR